MVYYEYSQLKNKKMTEKIYLYPGWLRIWHVINGILCLLLIISGLSMQYVDFEGVILNFKDAITLHNICGVILSINYLLFVIGNFSTLNGKQYKFRSKTLINDLFKQFVFYTIGIFKKTDPPFPISKDNKFNPLQRFTYILATYFALTIVILTGWAYLYPEVTPSHIFGLNGLLINDLIHVSVGYGISIFMIIHIYFCTIGVNIGANFKSIITGWH